MLYFIASTYGSGAYNSSTYDSTTSTIPPVTSTGSNAGSNAGSSAGGNSNVLANTGFDVIAAVTLAALICLAAVVVRIWKRPGVKTTATTK